MERQSGNTGRTVRSTHLCWEPSFTGHQYVNKPKSRGANTVHGPMFLPFYKIIVSFFAFFWTRLNCAIIGCNLSKKHKLALYKTQSRQPELDQDITSWLTGYLLFFFEILLGANSTTTWGQTFKYHKAS